MKEVANYVTRNQGNAQYWVICGDLNSNGFDANIYNVILNAVPAGIADTQNLTSQQRPATSYNKGGESMDYIFYSSDTLNLQNLSYEPSLNALITHGHVKGDSQKPFYSDHCIVSATFTFADQKTEKEQANEKTAAQPIAVGATAATGSAGSTTYVGSAGTAAATATKVSAKNTAEWTDIHEIFAAEYLANPNQEGINEITQAVSTGILDLSAKNSQGKTLLDIATAAKNKALKNGVAEDNWDYFITLLRK